LALKDYERKKTSNDKQFTFSIEFIKKNAELVFIPSVVAAGLPFNRKESCMHGVLPVDSDNNASGYVTPIYNYVIIE